VADDVPLVLVVLELELVELKSLPSSSSTTSSSSTSTSTTSVSIAASIEESFPVGTEPPARRPANRTGAAADAFLLHHGVA